MAGLLAFVRAFRFVLLLVVSATLAGCQTSEVLDAKAIVEAGQPSRFAAVVMDASSGRTLYSESASETRYPASLTKMMTMYMLFEAIDSGRLSKSSLLTVSANAAAQPPSKLGVRAGDTISVDTAIRALAVKSANDVAVVVAENLAGSESAFAAQMTSRARSLGMGRTTFRNASGLHDSGQVTTATDMARLGIALRKRFPHHFSYFSLRQFSIAGREIRGHNKTLDMINGADGIKTGYTRASGYNLVTSVTRNGKLIVAVILGENSARRRDQRMAALIRANVN
jgi:D-alanyl-D-alanine carboxypeptidase